MEVGQSPGWEARRAKRSRGSINSIIPWGLGRRPRPPTSPPPPLRACKTTSPYRTQTQCHSSQKTSVPTATRGLTWHFATDKQTETGGHPDWMPVGLEHTDPTSQERKGDRTIDLCRTSDWSTRPPWIHPTILNPYTLLSLLPQHAKIYTCLDLKDSFFCILLSLVSQPIFSFEWEDPAGVTKEQLTWTCLPQGFKNSPTILGKTWLLTWTHSIQRGSDPDC